MIVRRGVGRKKLGIGSDIFKLVMKFVDVRDFVLNGLLKDERILSKSICLEELESFGRDSGRILETLKGSRWNLEAAEMARADMDFFLELEVGLKEILESAEFTGVKLVDNGNNFRVIES